MQCGELNPLLRHPSVGHQGSRERSLARWWLFAPPTFHVSMVLSSVIGKMGLEIKFLSLLVDI